MNKRVITFSDRGLQWKISDPESKDSPIASIERPKCNCQLVSFVIRVSATRWKSGCRTRNRSRKRGPCRPYANEQHIDRVVQPIIMQPVRGPSICKWEVCKWGCCYYPAGFCTVGVVVLADALVTDAQPPADVALVFHLVIMNPVVGQRLGRRQITAFINQVQHFYYIVINERCSIDDA